MIRRRTQPIAIPPRPDLAIGDIVCWVKDLPDDVTYRGIIEDVRFDPVRGDWMVTAKFRTWRPRWPAREFVRVGSVNVERAA
jgi:hypothetical protein